MKNTLPQSFTFAASNKQESIPVHLNTDDLQEIKEKAIQRFSVEVNWKTEPSLLSQKKQDNYRLIENICLMLQEGKLARLNQLFSTQWKRQSAEDRLKKLVLLDFFIENYHQSSLANRNLILFEKIVSQCLLELAPLNYWTGN